MSLIQASAVPRKPELLTCDKHGVYRVRYAIFGEKALCSRVCPKCVKESDMEKQAEEKRKHDEQMKKWRMSRIEKAGVSKRNIGKTFNSFRCDNQAQAQALAHCKDLCKDIVDGKVAKNTFMVGGVGTGKTHLASSIVHELIDDKTVCMIRLIELMRKLKDTWRRDSEVTEQKVIDHYGSIDLLIIDEVGIQFGSDAEKMFMFDIINTRYDNLKPTLMISNLSLDNIRNALGEQVVDRLREDGGKVLTFDFESQRK
ncbi:MAG: ATP-binding protein [Colwellia sp.]|nr:ATP-binding protein [Colwellia sp.]